MPRRGYGKFDYGQSSRVDYEAMKRERIPEKTDRTIVRDIFYNTITFFSAVVAGPPQTITGTAYAGETDTFGAGVVSRGAMPVTGTLYTNTQTFGASSLVSVFNEFLVMAGQSGAIAKLTNGVTPPSNIQAIDTSRVKIWNAGAWQGYVAGTNSSQTFDGTFTTAWGQESEYARNWLAKYPAGTLYIAKHTADGTHIMSTSGPDWNASPLGELLSGLNTKVAAALSNLSGASVTLHERRAIWDLGSSDALDAQSYAEAFYVNMLAIYAYQRTNWSIGKIAHVRVRTQNLPYAPIVRAAQNRIAYDDASATLIDVDDLTLADQYHFSSAGTITVGLRAWDALENGTSVEVPYTFVTLTLYTDADTFNSASVGLGSSPTQNLSPALYTDGDSFNSGSITTSFAPQTVTGTLYNDGTDSFNAATVANAGGSEDADTTAFFTANAAAGLTAPTTAQRAVYDTFVKAAKANNNWWAACDGIVLPATFDRGVAKRNLKSNAYHMVESASPVWSAFSGFTATGGKLTSPYNPTTAGGNYAQNSAHVATWIGNDNANNGGDFNIWSGAAGVFTVSKSATGPQKNQWRLNQSANSDLLSPPATTIHDFLWNRTGSTDSRCFVDGVDTYQSTVASIAPVSATIEIGAIGTAYCGRQYKAITWGGGLTTAQITQRTTDISNFLTGIASA